MMTKNYAIYLNKEYTSLENKEEEPAEPVHMNIRKDLNWLHFNDEPIVQDRQHVTEQQSCIFVPVAYPTITSSTRSMSPFKTTAFHT